MSAVAKPVTTHADSAAKLLARERPYAVDDAVARRLLIDP